MSGTVLILNGASSSGKSTLAMALQENLEEPYAHFDADLFRVLLPPRFSRWAPFSESREDLRFYKGLHRATAAFAEPGNNVILDHMLISASMLGDAALALAKSRAYLIGIRCSLDVLKLREAGRGDRTEGLAQLSDQRVHVGVAYDLQIDTAKQSAREAAQKISAWLQTNPVPRALKEFTVVAGATSSPCLRSPQSSPPSLL